MADWDVTTAAAPLEFDTQNNFWNSCYQIDSNHFINFWNGGASPTDSLVQVFTVNTSTWAVTTAASRKLFDTDSTGLHSCYQIDSNHFINFWNGGSGTPNGFVQVFTVNTSTWAVTTAATRLQFDTIAGEYNSCYQIDSNHFINFWRDNSFIGSVQVFTVNTSTWAVTTAAASLSLGVSAAYNSCCQIDSNHFINFWQSTSSDGFVQVFTVNTSTWAVTTAATSLEFDTQNNTYNSCYQIDSNHFINFWRGGATTTDGFVQVFTVNTSTWAVTTAATSLVFETDAGNYSSCYQIDSNHFINFWNGVASDGFAQVFTVNTSTWAVTTAAVSLEFDTQDCAYNSCYPIDSSHFINFRLGFGSDGFVEVFTVSVPASGSSIKTFDGLAVASVKTVDGLVIASVKNYNGLA